MRSAFNVVAVAVAAMLLGVCRVSAQGCNQGILPYTITCDTAPNGIINASRCSGFGSGGGTCKYCYQGSGDCVDSRHIDHQYYLANETPDTTCSTCNDICCKNPSQCYYNGSGQACDQSSCQCVPATPIIVDTAGRGFHLTSAEAGVTFDILGDGYPIRIAWTAAASGDAFLALDRNHNERIDDGKELFGNVTEQPRSDHPNGFLALAEFDKPENGGNGDGIIDSHDAVFSRLLLWIDGNHNGISEPSELHSLPELGVYSIGLHYRDDQHFFDEYGNWFHYQVAVNPESTEGTSKDGRVAYDVFFLVAPPDVNALGMPMAQGQKKWELSLDYDLALGLQRQGQSRCRPRVQADNPGGAQ